MNGYLLDTNVISEMRKTSRSAEVVAWMGKQDVMQLFTSDVTMAELCFGAELVDDLVKRQKLKEWIAEIIHPWMQGRILKVNEDVLVQWRILSRHMKKVQRYSPEADMLIAAVAFKSDLVVVTRDQNPFVMCGIPTINPWTGERFNGA
jgi:toxin FitB